MEQRAAIGRQADDLAVEHARLGAHRVRDLLAQHRKLFVDVAAAGHERAVVALDVGERAEPVVFQLEQPIRMIERIGDRHQRHRTPHAGHGVERTTTAGLRFQPGAVSE